MSKSQDARRSTNDDRLTERVSFRLSEEEVEKVDNRADRHGVLTRRGHGERD
jgi:predicted DNA binding CopG/RHH family protein